MNTPAFALELEKSVVELETLAFMLVHDVQMTDSLSYQGLHVVSRFTLVMKYRCLFICK
jgi:hypothetical protein